MDAPTTRCAPWKMTPDFITSAEGSVLIEIGNRA